MAAVECHGIAFGGSAANEVVGPGNVHTVALVSTRADAVGCRADEIALYAVAALWKLGGNLKPVSGRRRLLTVIF